jgi:hypothetical protein
MHCQRYTSLELLILNSLPQHHVTMQSRSHRKYVVLVHQEMELRHTWCGASTKIAAAHTHNPDNIWGTR